MAKITVQEQKDLTILPTDSILHLKVDELSIREVDGRHGKWEKLEFKFKILGIQAVGDGRSADLFEDCIAGPIWGSVPFRLTDSAENKLRQWAEAILGIELGVGFELDTDLLMGRECRGITSQYEKRARDSQGNPLKGHQIASLLPRGGQPQAAAQAPAQAVQDPWAAQQPTQQSPQPTPQQAQQGMWEEPPF